MQPVPPGDGLLFVRGLSRTLCRQSVQALCELPFAIVNPNDSFVLGGSGEALDTLAGRLRWENGWPHAVTRIAVKCLPPTPCGSLAQSSAFSGCAGKKNNGRPKVKTKQSCTICWKRH